MELDSNPALLMLAMPETKQFLECIIAMKCVRTGRSVGLNTYCDVPGSPCLSKKGESSMRFVSFLNFLSR